MACKFQLRYVAIFISMCLFGAGAHAEKTLATRASQSEREIEVALYAVIAAWNNICARVQSVASKKIIEVENDSKLDEKARILSVLGAVEAAEAFDMNDLAKSYNDALLKLQCGGVFNRGLVEYRKMYFRPTVMTKSTDVMSHLLGFQRETVAWMTMFLYNCPPPALSRL